MTTQWNADGNGGQTAVLIGDCRRLLLTIKPEGASGSGWTSTVYELFEDGRPGTLRLLSAARTEAEVKVGTTAAALRLLSAPPAKSPRDVRSSASCG